MSATITGSAVAGMWTYLDVEIAVGEKVFCQTIIVPSNDVDDAVMVYDKEYTSAILAIKMDEGF